MTARRTALQLAGGAFWYLPRRFDFIRLLGPQSLRCVLFHDISDTESSFTRGLGITISKADFLSALKYLKAHYNPVSVDQILGAFAGDELPARAVLVTFDDAYKSVCEVAAPLCSTLNIPAVFFVNASNLDDHELALDNLICYVVNIFGLGPLNTAIATLKFGENIQVQSLGEFFGEILPSINLEARRSFRAALIDIVHIDERQLVREAGLYASTEQLRQLRAFNVEIGNHTFSHVNCRSLTTADFETEIYLNRAKLESASGAPVRTFSVPYGSSADLSSGLVRHLQDSGYEAIFLAEGRANTSRVKMSTLDRVSMNGSARAAFFSEIEVLPRLRNLRKCVLRRHATV